MLPVKKKRTKEVKRIQKRKAKILYQKIALTVVLSCFGIGIAYLFSTRYTLVSPMPPHSSSTGSNVIKKVEIELKKQQINATDIDENGDEITITLDKNQKVIMASTQNFQSELASLQLIIRQLTMEGKRFERVDLRFDKPVIVYGQ